MLEYLLLVVVIGLVVGGLARLAVPGPDPMPIWGTIALGLVGSFLGGVLATALGTRGGFLFAFGAAVLLLIAYRRFVQKRALTGPTARRRP